MGNLRHYDETQEKNETTDLEEKMMSYKSLIRRIFFVSRSNSNIHILEYLVFHGPKSFRQIALSTRLSYKKLSESLDELVRSGLVRENIFALSDKKLMKMYDVSLDFKDILKEILGKPFERYDNM